jgi:hypothetical protein
VIPAEPHTFWWRDAFFDDYKKDKRKDSVNPMMERAAWLYEMVRAFHINRVPNDIPLPSFPELRKIDKISLEVLVETIPYMRPIFRFGARSSQPSETKYSDPFPSIALDLTADDAALGRVFLTWLNRQRDKHGHQRPTGRKKAQRSHNKRLKDPIWQWVELLHHRKGEHANPLSETERGQKRDAKVFAEKYEDLVLTKILSTDQDLSKAIDSVRGLIEGNFPEPTGQSLPDDEVGNIAESLIEKLTGNNSNAIKMPMPAAQANKSKQRDVKNRRDQQK